MEQNQLVGQQKEALQFLRQFASGTSPKAALKGYAGVGKTHLVCLFVEELVAAEKKVCLAAPTHKALAVLRNKCDADVSYRTVASLTKTRLKVTEHGERIFVSAIGESGDDVAAYDFIIVDEASMIDVPQFNNLDKVKAASAKILYVGDPAQLPPINGGKSVAFDVPDSFLMEEIVRQQEGNPIIQLSVMLRGRISQGERTKATDLDMFLQLSDNRYTSIYSEWLYDLFKMARIFTEDVHILGFTNAAVLRHNAAIHNLLYPGTDHFAVGEKVIADEMFEAPLPIDRTPDDEKAIINNEEEFTVLSCSRAEGTYIPAYKLLVKRAATGRDHELLVARDYKWVQDREKELIQSSKECSAKSIEAKAALTFLENWKTPNAEDIKRAKEACDALEVQRVAIKNEQNLLSWFHPIRHGYAMTVHKSQGSTFDSVILDYPDICKQRDDTTFNKLLYVGATRAAKNLVFTTLSPVKAPSYMLRTGLAQ